MQQITQLNVQQIVPQTVLMSTVLEPTVPKPGAIQHVDLILSVEQLIVHKELFWNKLHLY